MSLERLKNVLGQEAEIYVPLPTDNAQNYSLDSKYLTRDYAECRACISKEEAIKIVLEAVKKTSHKWTPPATEKC